jgi:phospholipase C
MKLFARITMLILPLTVAAQAQIKRFDHIVVIVQENRTPDNLFQGLCAPPYGSSGSCNTMPSGSQYNIQTSDWLNKAAPGGKTQPGNVSLTAKYDLGHGHPDFVAMCDLTGSACKMDGAAGVACKPKNVCKKTGKYPQFMLVENSGGLLNPYLELAKQYGWANYMFQTNQGPSFPAHQFLFGGTSAPTTLDDAKGVFASENMSGTGISGAGAPAGCTAPDGPPPKPQTRVKLIDSTGSETALTPIYPCFEHDTMGDLLSSTSWKFYAPNATSIWTAPNAIKHICVSSGPGGHCTGTEWSDHVDLTSADVLRDINNCKLPAVSWVIPTGQNSDHANDNDGGGPSWVASIVNGIGHSSTCDNNKGYWENTAIFLTWDDWGGWYDHEPPTILPSPEGGYQYGFRVPLIVISAYTPAAYVDNGRFDFGSILRYIEHNAGIQEGALNFADARAKTESDLTGFFNLAGPARIFKEIQAPKDANFFLTDKRAPKDPDDD